MNRPVELGLADRDEGRPFAYPEHNAVDVAALAVMAARLRQLITQSGQAAGLVTHQPYELRSPQGHRPRLVVNRPEQLRASCDLALVGFFGHRRPVVPPQVIAGKDSIDLELIAEFPQQPGVLAYCSMALDDADYGNLVLMAQPETMEQ